MKKHADPAIDQIRATRMALSQEFGHDIDRMCEHLRARERARKRKPPTVSRPAGRR